MLKQKLKISLTKIATLGAVLAIAITGVSTRGFGVLAASCSSASDCQAQISNLSDQNNQAQANINTLESQAGSYQAAIASLQGQIAGLNQQIADNENQQVQAQADLDHEKQTLADNIRTMYLEGNISPLEILASSKSLSQYADRQQYRNAVSDKVQASVNKIKALQNQLVSLHNALEAQQAQLNASEAEQSRLLSLNESQQNQFNQQISANNSQIASLRAQQAALNKQLGGVPVAGDPGHGGYPAIWNNSPQDSLTDNWGMFNRECVSYTAWKVYQTYGNMPYWGGAGNANQWPADARAAGIPTGTTPKAGSVAIWNVGYYGHAMWVEAVNGNTIWVSQYNYDYQGHYSEMSISASGLTYIYFGDR